MTTLLRTRIAAVIAQAAGENMIVDVGCGPRALSDSGANAVATGVQSFASHPYEWMVYMLATVVLHNNPATKKHDDSFAFLCSSYGIVLSGSAA
jgi:hypothetical protein